MTKIKISSFNVNSIRARLPNLLSWLKSSNPDIVCLQELKCLEENFPFEELLDAGYNSAVSGQKSYNGVAILSKFKIEDISKSIPENKDEQARYIEAVIPINNQAIRVSSIYVPNGGGELAANERLEESAKFQYKMDFFNRLENHFSSLLKYDEMQIFGGDYNVAVEEIDVYDPKSLKNTVCFHDLEREKFRKLLNLGFADSYRAFNNQSQSYSWWDYRAGAWQHNKGMRIDYLLTSPKASDKIINSVIEDKDVRGADKASDHAPVSVELEF